MGQTGNGSISDLANFPVYSIHIAGINDKNDARKYNSDYNYDVLLT